MRRLVCRAGFASALSVIATVPLLAQAPAPADGAELIARMQKSTVQVICEGGWGSGFAVNDPRTIITNAHVVVQRDDEGDMVPCADLRVRAWDGAIVTARVVVVDAEKDVAVLSTDGSLGVTPAPLRADGGVKVGEEVYALGFPKIAQGGDRSGVRNPEARVTRGPVSRSAYPERNGARFVLDHSAGIYPGNSGGPLFDACGRVVGVNTYIAMDLNRPVGEDGSPTLQSFGSVGFAVGTRTIAEVLGKSGTPPALAGDGCTVGFGTIVGATVAAAKGTSPEAQATVKRLEASYQRFRKDYDAKWEALQLVVQQGDSAETARAQQAEASLAGLLNDVQGQLNANIAGATQRIDALDNRFNAFESQFRRWMQYVMGGLAVLALAIGGVFWMQRRDRGQVERKMAGLGAEQEEMKGDLDRIRQQLREHDLRLQQAAMAAVAKLSAEDAKGGRDARQAMDILQGIPGFSAESMSPQLRTVVARTVRDAGNQTMRARTVRDTGMATVRAADPGELVARVTVRDGQSGTIRQVELPVGAAVYIGRHEGTLHTVAQRFPFAPLTVLMGADDARVSRCHLSISNEGDGIRVTDLSLNGTFASVALPSLQRGTQPVDGGRRNRPDLLEQGDSAKLTQPVSLALARQDSGLTVDIQLAGAPALHTNN